MKKKMRKCHPFLKNYGCICISALVTTGAHFQNECPYSPCLTAVHFASQSTSTDFALAETKPEDVLLQAFI